MLFSFMLNTIYMDKKLEQLKRKTKATNGQNVRITTEGHSKLADFCRQNNYVLGGFVELAAIEKMEKIKKQK